MSVRSIPVLAFHAIQPGPGPLRLDAGTFGQVVDALHAAGATAITAAQAGAILGGEATAPAKPVVFTFDDGYASVHTAALPVLRAAGWVATVFPVTAHLGGRNEWDGAAGDDLRLLDEEQLRELHDGGWEVGGHTHRHRSLRGVSASDVDDEASRADDVIRSVVGEAPVSFAYPFGHHDGTSRDVVRQRYRWCWTIGSRRATAGDDVAALPRIEAWYVRRPLVARHLHDASGTGWLAARDLLRSLRAAARR